jgi:hypothetical protein
VLAGIPDYIVNPGTPVSFTASATDPDVPQQALYWMLMSAPKGASITYNTGAFYWRPPVAQAGSSNLVRVRVFDNGYPSMSATQDFSIIVNPLVVPVLGMASAEQGGLYLQFAGQEGPDYHVEASTNLVTWTTLVLTNGQAVSISLEDRAVEHVQRFYRLRIGP